MSQSWGGGGGWGQGGYPPPPGGATPGGGFGGAPPGGYPPPGGGGYGPPPGGGGYGPPPGGGFAPPPPGYPPGYTPMGSGGSVAWEDKSKGLFARWWGTAKDVNFNPRSLFAGAAQSEDPWPSITFGVMNGGIIGVGLGIFVAIVYLAFGSVLAAMMSSVGGTSSGGPGAGALVGIMSIVGVAAIFIYPLELMFLAFVGPWISGGLNHLCLTMLKGATKPYMSTVRVSAYAQGANLWMLVPGFGPFVAIIFHIIATIVGLDETHKCGTGKAIAAVFLPLVLFCGCCCLFYVFMGAIGAVSTHHR